MGLLVDGVWRDQWYDTKKSGGAFVRSDSAFRRQITRDGEFPAEPGRYHLYVSLACAGGDCDSEPAPLIAELKGGKTWCS